jgi:hypothetical protein
MLKASVLAAAGLLLISAPVMATEVHDPCKDTKIDFIKYKDYETYNGYSNHVAKNDNPGTSTVETLIIKKVLVYTNPYCKKDDKVIKVYTNSEYIDGPGNSLENNNKTPE